MQYLSCCFVLTTVCRNELVAFQAKGGKVAQRKAAFLRTEGRKKHEKAPVKAQK